MNYNLKYTLQIALTSLLVFCIEYWKLTFDEGNQLYYSCHLSTGLPNNIVLEPAEYLVSTNGPNNQPYQPINHDKKLCFFKGKQTRVLSNLLNIIPSVSHS